MARKKSNGKPNVTKPEIILQIIHMENEEKEYSNEAIAAAVGTSPNTVRRIFNRLDWIRSDQAGKYPESRNKSGNDDLLINCKIAWDIYKREIQTGSLVKEVPAEEFYREVEEQEDISNDAHEDNNNALCAMKIIEYQDAQLRETKELNNNMKLILQLLGAIEINTRRTAANTFDILKAWN